MNVDEAIERIEDLLRSVGCYEDREAIKVIRAHVERKVDDAMVNDALMDSQYAAGMLLGWNLCEAGMHAEFNKIREARMTGSLRAIKEYKLKAALGVGR